jgi:hypothetical protein
MSAEIVTEVFRTQEDREKHKFSAVVTITYFNGTATLQGLSGKFSKSCWTELQEYLLSKGVQRVQFLRKGVLKVIDRDKAE